MDQITEAIRRWMVAQDMSLGQLSGRSGIPKTTLLRRLNHPVTFTVGELDVIASVLGCRVLDLWTASNDGGNGDQVGAA